MKKKMTAGFTLVELIVVIAILGILAGIGTVGYSGYIKKANIAADNQLLGYINQAYATACIENGVDMNSLTSSEAKIVLENQKVKSIAPADYQDEFDKYYAGNEDSSFKVVTKVTFDDTVHMFVATETKTITVNGVEYNISTESINNYKSSAFNGKEEALQTQVDSLTSAYGDLVGILDVSQLGTAFGSDYAAYITEQLDDLGITSSDPEYKAAISNATVLYVAQKSASLNAQSAMDTLANAKLYLMQNASANPTLMDVLEAAGSTGDPLTTAALMYGAVTAYANGSDSASATALKSQAASVTNATSLLDLFKAAANEDDFLDYCGTYTTDGSSITGTTPTDAFSADMEGYLGALDVLDTVSGEVDLTQSGTWSSDTVDELLAAILG